MCPPQRPTGGLLQFVVHEAHDASHQFIGHRLENSQAIYIDGGQTSNLTMLFNIFQCFQHNSLDDYMFEPSPSFLLIKNQNMDSKIVLW